MKLTKLEPKQNRNHVSYFFQILYLAWLIFFFPGLSFSYTHFPGLDELSLYPQIEDAKDHNMNQVLLRINNTGQIGMNVSTGNGAGHWPIGTDNNYIFGSGLWFGAKADVDDDGDLDKIFIQGYNPLAGDSELEPGRVGQDPEDPSARIFDSNDPTDLAEWPIEFRDPVSRKSIQPRTM